MINIETNKIYNEDCLEGMKRIEDKSKLIIELKEIHTELVDVYRELFKYKYEKNDVFKSFINNEYKENGVGSSERKAWDDRFCHRASYTLLNKILFVRICEDKGFMLNSEDYIAGEVIDPHIGKKLSKIGVQKWANLITNYTLGELIKFAFNDMRKSYKNIILYKEDKYEILNPSNDELSLKYINDNETTRKIVLKFEAVLNDIIEKLDASTFDFNNTDGNILGDVYEKFMDRETRKAVGQFYTPEFVIEYILKNTVEEADVVENPFVTVADISCGSGHFLIMAYDILKEKFLFNIERLREKYSDEFYVIKKNGKELQLKGYNYWVKENIHYHILKHCIYGADIDSFAVQLTTINLLLKDLENFTDEINVIECDSLIKWEEDYDWQDLKEQLSEEFETEIVTLPNLFGELEKVEVKRIREKYKLKHKDLSNVLEDFQLTRQEAYEKLSLNEFWSVKFDYVIGNPPYLVLIKSQIEDAKLKYIKENYLSAEYNPNLFALFMEKVINITKNDGIISMITPDIWLKNKYFANLRKIYLENVKLESFISTIDNTFKEAVVQTIIFIASKKSNKIESNIINIYKDLSNTSKAKWFNKIEYNKLVISCVDGFDLWVDNIEWGIWNKIYKNSDELNKFCYSYRGLEPRDNKKSLFKEKKDENYFPILRGRDIIKFYKFNPSWYVNFIYKEMKSNADLSKYQVAEKILVRKTGSDLIATFDDSQLFALGSLYLLLPYENKKTDFKYILGNLNSYINNYFYKSKFVTNEDAFPHIRMVALDKLCILKESNKYYSEISQLTQKLLEINNDKYSRQISNIFNGGNVLSNFVIFNKEKNRILLEEISVLNELNKLIFNSYELNIQEIKYILNKIGSLTIENTNFFLGEVTNYNVNIKQILEEAKQVLSKENFAELHLIEGISIDEIAKKFNYESITIALLRQEYADSYESWRFYNLLELNNAIKEYLKNEVVKILNENHKCINVGDILDILDDKLSNFEELINIIRIDNTTKKSIDIVKDCLNEFTNTWNSYVKNRDADKENKDILRYYDTKYYGLPEWSDEIHKKYFLHAIDEYTTINPNQRKANDILKLFKDLVIEDKEDYIDIIDNKIKKAFTRG